MALDAASGGPPKGTWSADDGENGSFTISVLHADDGFTIRYQRDCE